MLIYAPQRSQYPIPDNRMTADKNCFAIKSLSGWSVVSPGSELGWQKPKRTLKHRRFCVEEDARKKFEIPLCPEELSFCAISEPKQPYHHCGPKAHSHWAFRRVVWTRDLAMMMIRNQPRKLNNAKFGSPFSAFSHPPQPQSLDGSLV